MKIKRCPCCASKAQAQARYDWWEGPDRIHRVVCCSCGLMTANYKAKKFAVEAWNRRANDVE